MFYHYSQNNSDGSFDYDTNSGISVNVIIEANSAEESDAKAETIGLYFNGKGDCPCCGNRWYRQWEDSDGKEAPSVHGIPVEEYNPREELCAVKWINNGFETFVHYADGTFKGFHL